MNMNYVIAAGVALAVSAAPAYAVDPYQHGTPSYRAHDQAVQSSEQSSQERYRGRMVSALPDVEVKGLTQGLDVGPGTFVVISTNGSITRALCPHTCEQRGIPRSSCRSWQSKIQPGQCYVEDTRKPSDAVPMK